MITKHNWLLHVLTLFACSSSGGTWQHYRISAFEEAKDRNMAIALHFYDSAEKKCEEQKKQLERVVRHEKFKKLGAYRVQFNSEKKLQASLGIREGCTIVVLRGAREVGRLNAPASDQQYENLLGLP